MRVCTNCHCLLADSATLCPYDGAALAAVALPAVPRELDAKFGELEAVAQGKTGTCFRATQRQSGYRGLLKVIPLAAMDAAERARLKRELRKQTRLSHDGLARIIDGGEVGDALWIFREFIEGESLGQRLRRDGKLEPGHALAITAQVASALDELQRSGLLHRDIKPGHVLLTPASASLPQVKLIDAGIAGRLPTTTVFGLHGTPAYISPEQVAGKLVSFRSDLYALGCVLFETLTAAPPFVGDDVAALLEAHKNAPMPNLELALPNAVSAILRAMLAKEPRQRPFSAQQVRRTLEPFLPQGTKLPALSARTAGAVPAPAASASRVPAPPRDSTQHAVARGRDEITQDFDLDEIEAARGAENATMAISEAELRELEVSEAETDHATPEHATMAIDEAELEALVSPTEPPTEPPTTVQPAQLAAPARPAVDFDVESLFGDSVPADPPLSTPPPPRDPAPTQHYRSSAAAFSEGNVEPDPEGTVVAGRPITRRKPSPFMWLGGALLVGIVLLMLWPDDEPELKEGTKAAPSAPVRPAQPAPAKPEPPVQAAPSEAPAVQAVAAAPEVPSAAPTAAVSADPAVLQQAPQQETAPAPARGSRAERLAKAEEWKAQARAHYQAKRYKEAASAYAKATEQDASDAGAFAGLAASRLSSGDTKGAVDAYSRATRLQPKSSGFHAALGRAYLQHGDRDRARAAYERALKLNPKNSAAQSGLAQVK